MSSFSNSPSPLLVNYAKANPHLDFTKILHSTMATPLTIPPEYEIIFRQDLRPGDTIIPFQSQILLTTLADDTPSELQPIVVMPQDHGHARIANTNMTISPMEWFRNDTTATTSYRPAEPPSPAETRERKPSIVKPSAAPIDTHAQAQATIIGKTTPALKPALKVQPRGDRIRRSRRQQTPDKS